MSIEINLKTFKLLFPELEIEEELFYILKEFAIKEVSKKIWGKFYEEGVLTLIAHLYYMRKNSIDNLGIPSLPVSSTTVGSVSVGYAVPNVNSSEEFYNNSAYGQRYLHLRRLTKTYITVA